MNCSFDGIAGLVDVKAAELGIALFGVCVRWLKTASAMVERQMLPKQTKRIETGSRELDALWPMVALVILAR